MLYTLLTLFVLVSFATSENCVRYTFEKDNDDLLSNESGVCLNAGTTSWNFKDYNDSFINTQPERSTKFISPQSTPSCVSSFVFPMSAGGVVEVNIYMESAEYVDQINVLGHQVVKGSNDAVVGSAGTAPLFSSGWQTLRFTLGGTGTYDGYITIMGMADPSSAVLVDSFRYLPPGMYENECELYGGEETQTSESEIETDQDTFWTKLNIAVILLVSLLVIILLSTLCYCCCQKQKVKVIVA